VRPLNDGNERIVVFFFTFLAVLHYWRLLAERRIKFSYT
jgi:hypothetical protein